MYIIKIDDKYTIQNSINNVVINPVLIEKLNGVPSLEYSVSFDDEYINMYARRKTKVEVLYDNVTSFKGRLLDITENFDGSKKVKFEGELGYLNDIQYPPFEFSGDYDEFFRNIIDYYNSKCDQDNQFIVGQVTLTDSNHYIVRSSDSYSDCWSLINDKILKYGGYLKVRYIEGKRYIDLLAKSGSKAKQSIEFGKNLMDLENYIDSSNIATVIIPLGAKANETEKLEDNIERTYTADRVDVRTVNDNDIYVESRLVNIFGRVEKVVTWDDVTVPRNLLTKAQKKIAELAIEEQTLNIQAIDLHFSNGDQPYYKVGDIISVMSKPHNLDAELILTSRTRYLNEPSKDTFKLGNQEKTLSSSVNDNSNATNDIEEKIEGNFINNIIKNQTSLIANGKDGHVIYGFNEKGKLSEIYFCDTEDLATAINVMRLNKNGLGFSNDGFYGTYRNAWTIDGTLNADFINAGQLSCNFINGGVLRLGNVVNRDGRIEIYNEKGRLVSTYDKDGIKIFNENGNSIVMNDIEFAGYDSAGNVIFTVQNDKFVMNKAEINTQIDIAKRVRLMYVNDEETGSEGIGIVPIV